MTASPPDLDLPPFSRPLPVDTLPQKGVTVVLRPSDEERAALAEALDIVSVDRLSATVTVTPWRRSGVKVSGTVDATVAQACVVTLEPVAETVREEISLTFLPAAEIDGEGPEVDVDVEGQDPPEALEGRHLDLGVIVTEYVALGLDPYPRKPGVSFEPLIEDDGSNDAPPSPFAGLKAKLAGETND